MNIDEAMKIFPAKHGYTHVFKYEQTNNICCHISSM